MGHIPGTPCLHSDPNHGGGCSSIVVSPFVDLTQTRWFAITETGGAVSYWRTNATAPFGVQVEHRWLDGSWHKSMLFDTEAAFKRSIGRWVWREITAEEVPS